MSSHLNLIIRDPENDEEETWDRLSLWVDEDDEPPANIAFFIQARWGEPVKSMRLSPKDARVLAKYLTDLADTSEAVAREGVSESVD